MVDGDEDGSAGSELEQPIRAMDITIPIVAVFTDIEGPAHHRRPPSRRRFQDRRSARRAPHHRTTCRCPALRQACRCHHCRSDRRCRAHRSQIVPRPGRRSYRRLRAHRSRRSHPCRSGRPAQMCAADRTDRHRLPVRREVPTGWVVVSCKLVSPSDVTLKISRLPPPAGKPTNAICVPSGDHEGSVSSSGPIVRSTSPEPSASRPRCPHLRRCSTDRTRCASRRATTTGFRRPGRRS